MSTWGLLQRRVIPHRQPDNQSLLSQELVIVIVSSHFLSIINKKHKNGCEYFLFIYFKANVSTGAGLSTTFQVVQMCSIALCVMSFTFSKGTSAILSTVEKPILFICFLPGQSMRCSTLSCGSIREQFALKMHIHTLAVSLDSKS